MFQDLSRRSIETGFFCGFKTRLKFIKFGLWKEKEKIREKIYAGGNPVVLQPASIHRDTTIESTNF